MSHTQAPWSIIAILVCALISHSCQQPMLNVGRDETTKKYSPTPQEVGPKSEQNMEATAMNHKLSSIMLSSSSVSLPDSKHVNTVAPDLDATAQPMPWLTYHRVTR